MREPELIREAEKGDFPELARMAGEYFRELGLELDPQGLDRDVADPARAYQGGGILVALDQGRPVGMVGLRVIDPGTGEIKRMYIRASARSAGLGRRLMEAVIDLARQRGLTRLVLDTKLELKAANALYESFGFKDIEDYNQNPRAQRFMRLDLGG